MGFDYEVDYRASGKASVLVDDVSVGVIGHRGSVPNIGCYLDRGVALVDAEADVRVAAVVRADV